MKKRLLLLMVIVVMSAGMVACGNEETKENVADNEVQEESVESEVTETTQTPTEDSDEDVSIEVVEGTAHSAEYNERFELGERTGATYMKAGDSEVTEFSDWKEGYSTLIEDIEADGTGTGYALIYINEDEIPELAYYAEDGKLIIATFSEGYVYLFSSQLNQIYYDEKNNVCLAKESVEADLNDYVVAIKDGFWVEIAYGVQRPIDVWAEDSFDENGNPIISYWEINGEELPSQEKYDELLAKYYNVKTQGSEVIPSETADTILAEIEAM